MIEPMKALTVWQPHASLIAVGAKRYGTRSWATKHRGLVAIHAGLRLPKWLNRFIDWQLVRAIQNALFADCKHVDLWSNIVQLLPRGRIIATAELVGCYKIGQQPNTILDIPVIWRTDDEYDVIPEEEELFGDYTPGRYAWEFRNVQMLDTPIPAKGRQGLWNWGGVA